MTDDYLVGETIAGKYRVETVLGKGGMGVVLGARHLKLDEPVAIKLLRPTMMQVEGMTARFLREARAASKIKSVHVARVTDVDTLEDGTPYMVMEHLSGIDFAELRKQKGAFEIAEAVGYLREACDAIAEAHSLGIVHRDLKPSNLFLHKRRDGKALVKVLDFGISKVDAPGEQDSTKTGQMMGSPKYMSPEQMLSMHDVDARSDIWSLGAILYELVTGRAPFMAETTPRICALVLNAEPAPPGSLRPELPADLERAIVRCLEKDPDRRFTDVGELVTALAPFGGAPLTDPSPRSTGTNPSAQTPASDTAPTSVAAQTNVLPSVTPATGTVRDATTRIEAPPRKSHTRLIASLAGVALAALLGALYARNATVPVHADEARAPAATPALAATGTTPAPVVTAAPTPSDLPDVEPSVSPTARPVSAGGAGSFAKKPKPGPSADPFGGRRN